MDEDSVKWVSGLALDEWMGVPVGGLWMVGWYAGGAGWVGWWQLGRNVGGWAAGWMGAWVVGG